MNNYRLSAVEIQFIIDHGRGNNDAALTALINENFGTNYPISKIRSARYRYGAVSGIVTTAPNSGSFKKGHTTYNKGKKQTEYMSAEAIERTKATRFQPGHIPSDHKEVGSETLRGDGYIWIKVAEPNKWKPKHRVVWEEQFGRLLPGEIVIFLDNDRTNCDIENLAVITKDVNARLNQNHLRAARKEITSVAITLGKLIAKTGKAAANARKRK